MQKLKDPKPTLSIMLTKDECLKKFTIEDYHFPGTPQALNDVSLLINVFNSTVW